MKFAKYILSIILALGFLVSESIILPSSGDARGKSGGGYKSSASRGSISRSSSSSTRVRGYTTKRGTYVAPHQRSTPNKSKVDNWSTKGNVNPYTGKKGSRAPDR